MLETSVSFARTALLPSMGPVEPHAHRVIPPMVCALIVHPQNIGTALNVH